MPDLSNLANNPRLQALRDDPELADFFHDLEAEGMNGAMRCAAAAAPCASHGVRSRLTPPRPPPPAVQAHEQPSGHEQDHGRHVGVVVVVGNPQGGNVGERGTSSTQQGLGNDLPYAPATPRPREAASNAAWPAWSLPPPPERDSNSARWRAHSGERVQGRALAIHVADRRRGRGALEKAGDGIVTDMWRVCRLGARHAVEGGAGTPRDP